MTGLHGGLRDYWYPVALSSAIGEKPVGTRLLGEEIVLWRSNDGIAALRDHCIHRGTRLSLGWVEEHGLVCPYHGWCYRKDGVVCRIPSLPADRAIPARARVNSFRCMERYGLVFVCLGEPRRAIYEVPEFEHSDFRTHILGPVQWVTGAARSFENFIDEAHLPWVHPGALGDRNNVPPIPSRDVQEKEGEFYFEYESECASRIDPSKMTKNLLTYDVVLPFSLYHENITPEGERVIDLFFVTPLSETESVRYMVVARNFALDLPPDKFIRFTLSVWEQDRVLVESQRPAEAPLDLHEELHLRGPDGPSIIYRRMLQKIEAAGSAELRGSSHQLAGAP